MPFPEVLPQVQAKRWSLTTLREKLLKIGAKVVSHGQYVTFQLAEVAHTRSEFVDHDDPALKRHLVRTWHRDWGQRTFDG